MTCIIAFKIAILQLCGKMIIQLLNHTWRTFNTLRYAFIFLFTCSAITGHAQGTAWTQYSTSNSPLPENNVRCIVFENDSTAWIGTQYGLARFDGMNWVVYNTFNSGISGNDIRSIAIDRQGAKWIGTFNNGLDRFDGTTWINFNTQNSPLPDDFVRSLAIDTNDTKWVGTIGGLARLDTAGTWTNYTMWNSAMGSNNITDLYVDTTNNDKWGGTVNGGLLLIEDDTVFSKYTIQNSGITDNSVLDIARDASGNLYLATPANGMCLKLANNAGWFTYNTINFPSLTTPGLTSLDIAINGDTWIGTFDKGVVRKRGNSFIVFNTFNSPLSDSVIQTIVISPLGKIFIGTQTEGLYILDPSLLTNTEEQVMTTDGPSIFPNPTTGPFRWNSSRTPEMLEVFGADGRRVAFFENPSINIDLTGLPGGVYQLVFGFRGGGKAVQRLVVR
jgi:ligand-binding sensor domain-containing protein